MILLVKIVVTHQSKKNCHLVFSPGFANYARDHMNLYAVEAAEGLTWDQMENAEYELRRLKECSNRMKEYMCTQFEAEFSGTPGTIEDYPYPERKESLVPIRAGLSDEGRSLIDDDIASFNRMYANLCLRHGVDNMAYDPSTVEYTADYWGDGDPTCECTASITVTFLTKKPGVF